MRVLASRPRYCSIAVRTHKLVAVLALPPIKVEYDVAVSEEAVQGVVEAARGVPQEQRVVGIIREVRGDRRREARSKWGVPLNGVGVGANISCMRIHMRKSWKRGNFS